MQDVGRQGRTVLFVSHNMPAITRLCPRTICWMRAGLLAMGLQPGGQRLPEYRTGNDSSARVARP